MHMEPVYLVGALAGGSALAGAAIWAAWRFARPLAATAEKPVPLEIVIEDKHPATFVPRPREGPAPAPRARATTHAAPAPAPSAHRPAPSPAPPFLLPPPSRAGVLPPRGHVERAPAMVLTPGVELRDAMPHAPPARPFVRAPSAGRPPMREPPPMKSWAQQVMESAPPEVPTEWARRQVGPVEPGRTAGACGGCGSRLSVSSARPVRIACPVCGRTKLLAS